jgi:threonine/homoserine/homoserine lactone efflux protein
MIQLLLGAIGAGLLMTIMTGPGFFSLIRTSIQKGFLAGAVFAIGIFSADLIFVSITLLGAKLLSVAQTYQNYIAIIGSVFLGIIGYRYFSKPAGLIEEKGKEITLSKLKFFAYYFKGLLMNLLNPGMLFYWIGLVSYLSTSATYSQDEIKIFLITCMGTVLSTDIIKAYFAAKMRHLFNPKVIHLMNRIVGIALMIFAFAIIAKLFLLVA